MKDIKPIIRKLKDYIEKTEYWGYEDGLVLGSDEAQIILSALEENERRRKAFETGENEIRRLLEIAKQVLITLK